ncbi:MAG: hypothetical protein ACXV3S_12570, partial [Kineosporiaceae bacterium]
MKEERPLAAVNQAMDDLSPVASTPGSCSVPRSSTRLGSVRRERPPRPVRRGQAAAVSSTGRAMTSTSA